ncbi:hypothetical protein JB92DRAFT_2945699 [Gautieria morchelliformis]|nr:hypothetical protein JB92DRAFT_2945699 [Gautieria morchelliformis]
MLHLFARVVSDLCRSAEILMHAFELLGAFDEIVSLGWRDQINLMQGYACYWGDVNASLQSAYTNSSTSRFVTLA